LATCSVSIWNAFVFDELIVVLANPAFAALTSHAIQAVLRLAWHALVDPRVKPRPLGAVIVVSWAPVIPREGEAIQALVALLTLLSRALRAVQDFAGQAFPSLCIVVLSLGAGGWRVANFHASVLLGELVALEALPAFAALAGNAILAVLCLAIPAFVDPRVKPLPRGAESLVADFWAPVVPREFVVGHALHALLTPLALAAFAVQDFAGLALARLLVVVVAVGACGLSKQLAFGPEQVVP